jgi:hypothetical protein
MSINTSDFILISENWGLGIATLTSEGRAAQTHKTMFDRSLTSSTSLAPMMKCEQTSARSAKICFPYSTPYCFILRNTASRRGNIRIYMDGSLQEQSFVVNPKEQWHLYNFHGQLGFVPISTKGGGAVDRGISMKDARHGFVVIKCRLEKEKNPPCTDRLAKHVKGGGIKIGEQEKQSVAKKAQKWVKQSKKIKLTQQTDLLEQAKSRFENVITKKKKVLPLSTINGEEQMEDLGRQTPELTGSSLTITKQEQKEILAKNLSEIIVSLKSHSQTLDHSNPGDEVKKEMTKSMDSVLRPGDKDETKMDNVGVIESDCDRAVTVFEGSAKTDLYLIDENIQWEDHETIFTFDLFIAKTGVC